MLEPRPIQLDGALTYQEAEISATLRARAQSHGVEFVADFVRDHRAAILIAKRRHRCGRAVRTGASGALRLGLAYKGT